MSVGGKVTEVIIRSETVYINTDDGGDECAIFVELDSNSKRVKKDDIVWWQGRKAFWTTEDRSIVEKTLKRRGYSGVSRP